MDLYRCIKEFSVVKYDDDGWSLENEYYNITIGEIWSMSDSDFKIIGGPNSVHLDSDERHCWLEIDRDTFIEHFEKVED